MASASAHKDLLSPISPDRTNAEENWRYKVTVRVPRKNVYVCKKSSRQRRPVLMGIRFKPLMNRQGAMVHFIAKKAAMRTCKNGDMIAPGHVLTNLDGFSTLQLDLSAIVDNFHQHTLTRRPFVLTFVTDMAKLATKRVRRARSAASSARPSIAPHSAKASKPYRPRSGKIVKAAELPKRDNFQDPFLSDLEFPSPKKKDSKAKQNAKKTYTESTMTNEFGQSVMAEVKRVNNLNAQLRMQLRLSNQQIGTLQKKLKAEIERDKSRVEAHLTETQEMVTTIESMHIALQGIMDKKQRNSDRKDEVLSANQATVEHLKQELAARVAVAIDTNQLFNLLADSKKEMGICKKKVTEAQSFTAQMEDEKDKIIRKLNSLVADKEVELKSCARRLKEIKAQMPAQVQSQVRARTIEIEEQYQLADEGRLTMYMGAGQYLATASRLRAFSVMKRGTPATKVAFTSDKTQQRHLCLTVDERSIQWSSGRGKSRGKISSIDVSEVTAVLYGPHSSRMIATTKLMRMSPWTCFSFCTDSRTYDFLMPDETAALYFAHGLECLRVHASKGGAPRRLGRLLWSRAQMKLAQAAAKDVTTKRAALRTRILKASQRFSSGDRDDAEHSGSGRI